MNEFVNIGLRGALVKRFGTRGSQGRVSCLGLDCVLPGAGSARPCGEGGLGPHR